MSLELADSCTVTHTFMDPSGEPLEGVQVLFTVVPSWLPEGSYHGRLEAVSDKDGKIAVELGRGAEMLAYRVKIDHEPAFPIEVWPAQQEATLYELRRGLLEPVDGQILIVSETSGELTVILEEVLIVGETEDSITLLFEPGLIAGEDAETLTVNF
jgi:hypothetical protein